MQERKWNFKLVSAVSNISPFCIILILQGERNQSYQYPKTCPALGQPEACCSVLSLLPAERANPKLLYWKQAAVAPFTQGKQAAHYDPEAPVAPSYLSPLPSVSSWPPPLWSSPWQISRWLLWFHPQLLRCRLRLLECCQTPKTEHRQPAIRRKVNAELKSTNQAAAFLLFNPLCPWWSCSFPLFQTKRRADHLVPSGSSCHSRMHPFEHRISWCWEFHIVPLWILTSSPRRRIIPQVLILPHLLGTRGRKSFHWKMRCHLPLWEKWTA